MKNKPTRGGVSKRPAGRSWALDRAQHKKEMEEEMLKAGRAGTGDDSDAAAGLMLLCNELSANEKLVRELSMEASMENGSAGAGAADAREAVAETRCPKCNAVLGTQTGGVKDAESPASVITPWQWGRVAECACQQQASSMTAQPLKNSGWNAGVVRELMAKPPKGPGVPSAMSARPPRPPQHAERFSVRRKEKKEAVAAMELVEMREEIMTDQRLIAELAQAALLPVLGEEIAT